jgi:hypothetical protein
MDFRRLIAVERSFTEDGGGDGGSDAVRFDDEGGAGGGVDGGGGAACFGNRGGVESGAVGFGSDWAVKAPLQ